MIWTKLARVNMDLFGFICNSSIRSFMATLGPAGGKRGYAGITGHVSNGLAWYMNGLLIPELWLRRGLTYSFKVSWHFSCHVA